MLSQLVNQHGGVTLLMQKTNYLLNSTSNINIDKMRSKNLFNFNNNDWTLKFKINITRRYSFSNNIMGCRMKILKNDTKNIKSRDVIQYDLDVLTFKYNKIIISMLYHIMCSVLSKNK